MVSTFLKFRIALVKRSPTISFVGLHYSYTSLASITCRQMCNEVSMCSFRQLVASLLPSFYSIMTVTLYNHYLFSYSHCTMVVESSIRIHTAFQGALRHKYLASQLNVAITVCFSKAPTDFAASHRKNICARWLPILELPKPVWVVHFCADKDSDLQTQTPCRNILYKYILHWNIHCRSMFLCWRLTMLCYTAHQTS